MSHIKHLLYTLQEEMAAKAHYDLEAMKEAMAEDAAQDEMARRDRSRADIPVATVPWL